MNRRTPHGRDRQGTRSGISNKEQGISNVEGIGNLELGEQKNNRTRLRISNKEQARPADASGTGNYEC